MSIPTKGHSRSRIDRTSVLAEVVGRDLHCVRCSLNLIDVSSLSVRAGSGVKALTILDNLSFSIERGTCLCVVGESGSGKSTAAMAIMGLLNQSTLKATGSIRFEGSDLASMSMSERRCLQGSEMAMVFQEPMTALNPCHRVGRQIEEVFETHSDLNRSELRHRSLALIEDVMLPEPERIWRSFPHQLSGGQRQRVMIAMALAMAPKLLIADEPTTALDVTTQAQILSMMNTLKTQRNAGILFVTHDFDVVSEIADNVLVMRHGKTVEHGSADQILNAAEHPYTRALINAVPRKASRTIIGVDHRKVALKVSGLNKTFDVPGAVGHAPRKVIAVKDAGFTLRRGETVGIVGESGSGKSTLARCAMRMIEPDSGQIELGEIDFGGLRPDALRANRKDIQIVFQDPFSALHPRRKISDLLIEGPLNFGVPRSEALQRARDLLTTVRIDPSAMHRYPSQFSGGQRQRICIARALTVRPKVLIADEAVSALDVSVQRDVLALLRHIANEFDVSILFITHDLRVATQICDRILVMQSGRIIETGTVEDVFEHPQHGYTQQLLSSQPGRGWKAPHYSEVEAGRSGNNCASQSQSDRTAGR